ncbi:MAG: 30S ribosome-binding factor RbfA [Alphaproteobacteria bacterium]|nr:30S ribosome-binding factor RbfA [Alphaproteobacteria bacterium]
MTRRSVPPGQRQLRVASLVREGLAELFSRGDVPELESAMVTVSEVRMSPDLRHATVFVTALGGEADGETLERLKQAGPSLSGELGRRLGLRFAPKLAFVRDTSFDRAARIEALLRPKDSSPQ